MMLCGYWTHANTAETPCKPTKPAKPPASFTRSVFYSARIERVAARARMVACRHESCSSHHLIAWPPACTQQRQRRDSRPRNAPSREGGCHRQRRVPRRLLRHRGHPSCTWAGIGADKPAARARPACGGAPPPGGTLAQSASFAA